jgi:RHS repeat-associated protein
VARFAVELSLIHFRRFNSIFKTDFRKECGLAVRRFGFLLALAPCLAGIGLAQVDPAAGIQMFSTRENNVDLATSSITVNFPIRGKAGKIPLSYSLVGNYHVYGETILTSHFLNLSSTGLQGQLNAHDYGYRITYTSQQTVDCNNNFHDTVYQNFVVIDQSGASHPLPTSIQTDSANPPCFTWPTTPQTTTDGSGLTAVDEFHIYDKSGVEYYGGTLTDPDGATVSTSGGTYTDSLGTTFLTATSGGGGGASDTYTYKDASGNNQNFTVAYKEYTLRSNFGCVALGYGYTDYNDSSAPAYLPYTITDPNGAVTTLTYETTPGVSGAPYGTYTTGRIASITFGSGGSISYAYSQNGDSQGNNGMDCVTFVVPKLTVTVNDNNGNSGPYTYVNSDRSLASPNNFTVTKTDPAGNQTAYNFSGEYQTQAVYHQGTGTVLKTMTTCYGVNGSTPPSRASCPAPSTTPTLPITETDVYTSLGTSSYNEVQTKFDATYRNVLSEVDYDFGASTILSQRYIAYGTYNGSACVSVGNYINDKPCVDKTENGSGTVLAESLFAYNTDGTLASLSKWTGPAENTWQQTSFGYGANGATAGILSSVTEPNGAVTSFGSFACNGMLPGATTYPLSSVGSDATTWDCNGAVKTYYSDVNGIVTAFSYSDPLYRLTNVSTNGGGPVSISYATGAALPWTIQTTKAINSSNNSVTTNTLDGLRRTVASSVTDPNNTSTGLRYTNTTYNALGQVYQNSNPYFSTSDSTYGSTTYTYDALGRITNAQDALGNNTTVSYTGNSTGFAKEISQPSGPITIVQVDGLGRVIDVCEVTSANGWGNCGLAISGSGFLWNTAYNTTSSGLYQVSTTSGLETRSFVYDGLGRMVSESTPEVGTKTYAYDSNTVGDLYTRTAPEENQTGTATVVTTYNYDLMHRLTRVSYNDSLTPTITYHYDASTGPINWGNSPSLPNGKGKLSWTATSANANSWDAVYGYDPMGNISVYGTCTIAGCAASTPVRFVNNLTYDYVENPVTGAGNIIGNAAWHPTYNSIGQLTVMNSNCIKWGGSSCTASGDLISNITYNAFGLPVSDSLDNGMSESWTYDKLGHVVLYSAGTGHYWFSLFWNSIDINASNDMINGNWNYSYDGTDRLSCAYIGSACNSSASEALSWGYDRYDNRIRQSVIAGTGFGSLYTINTKNQLTTSGFSYDAAGNMLNDTSHTYTYDAEGRIMTVDGGAGNGGETYNYNSRGLRNTVYFGSTVYERVFTPYGLPAALVEPGTGTMVTSEFYALGHLGTLQPGNSGYTTMFLLKDWLGTTREWADLGGNSFLSCQTFPYGEISGSGCPGNPGWSELGGLWYDGEDNTINTPARNYSISQGRWLTPDPAGLAAVDPNSPKTWNRFAYVTNNPVSFVDPLGLFMCGDCSDGGDDDDGGDGGGGGLPIFFLPGNICAGWGCVIPPGVVPIKIVVPGQTVDVTATPCSTDTQQGANGPGAASNYWTSSGDPNNPFWPRLKMLGTGLGNIGVGSSKITYAAGLEVGSGGLATGLALYGAWSSAGNFAAGSLQVLGAFMPNPQPFNQAAQLAAIGASVSGLSTLAAGGSVDAAAQNARFEGIFMSGVKLGATGNPPSLAQGYSGVLSTANSMGGSSTGCN